MAFIRPSLSQLSTQIQADFSRLLELKAPPQKASYVYVISQVLAGVHHLIYGNLTSLEKQLMPDTADREGLERWCNLYGIRKNDALPAQISVLFHGTPGAPIGAGTPIQRGQGGLIYTTILGAEIGPDGTAKVPCICTEAGRIGNVVLGTVFQLITPLRSMDSANIVSTHDPDNEKLGFDFESDVLVKKRLFQRIRNPGRGGTSENYISWSQETIGVGRTWVFENRTPGAIDVMFLTVDIDSPIPTEEMRANVHDTLVRRRPIGCLVNVGILEPKAINIDLKLPPALMDRQEVIRTSLKQFFFEETSPDSIITLAQIRKVISVAAQTEQFFLNTPTIDIEVNYVTIALLGDFICSPEPALQLR